MNDDTQQFPAAGQKDAPVNGPFPCPATGFRDYLVDAIVAYERYDFDSCDYDHDFDETGARRNAEQLIDKLIEGSTKPDPLRDAEIRAAVAEREAVAYRNQVQALVRSIQRERGVPEEEIAASPGAFVVITDFDLSGMTEQRVRELIAEAFVEMRRRLVAYDRARR